MTAFINNLKTVFLMALLTGLLIWVGSFWSRQAMIILGCFAVVMNFSAWFFSDKIAVAAMRCQEVNERTAPHLVEMVRDLSRRAGLPMPRVYICPQQAPNAFATGRNPHHAAVAVTAGALQLLSDDELRGVLAHELAHVKNRDTLTGTVVATIAGIFSSLAYSSLWFGGGNNREGGNPLIALAMVVLGALGAALIQAMISRSREYVADADGAAIAGGPNGLVSALQKLDAVSKRVPLENPNPAMNNMFIVEPLMGMHSLANLFATHPPMKKRIAALLHGR